ncbi:MarR family winged helix-turn-helix transcriptional regulator [Cryptosporangium japonicum]|uniref:MarR family winged helix-turn-helix transcriptional regulator n=1 Tax=Cryptosporangium japonicum TaxID=80872 RepID=UPI0031E1F8AE
MSSPVDSDALPSAALVNALMAMSRVLVDLTARTLGDLQVEMTLPQYRILVVLASRGDQRTVDLAAELGVTPSTATRNCDRLVRRRLVRRFRRTDDLRVSWLGLTAEGEEVIGETMLRRHRSLADLVARAAVDQPELVAGALDQLVVAAGEVPDPGWWQRLSASTDYGQGSTSAAMESNV